MMSRTKLALAVVMVIILGALCGWFFEQWFDGTNTTSPVTLTASGSAAVKPRAKNGFCCVEPGKGCLPADTAGMCFRSGGEAFNTVKRNCDYYCVHAKQ